MIVEYSKYYSSNLYYLEYSGYCFHLYSYIHSISADVLLSLLQVFLIKLGNFYLIQVSGLL